MRRSGGAADNRGVRHALASLPSPRPRAARFVIAALVTLPLASLLHAGDDATLDHDRARAAMQAGQVLPLATLLERLQRSHPGQVLELELEREGGRWVYEVKLLQAGGRLLKLELDAGSGQVLGTRQRRPGADRGTR